jgi:hypothetical protein
MLDTQILEKEAIVADSLCRESTRNLFGQPDVIAVHEYLYVYRSSNAYTPEIRLIAALLKDAIDCYLKHESDRTRRGKRIFSEAAQWIFGRHEDWLFSFENICEMLKIDPDYIRRVLRKDVGEPLPIAKLARRRLPRELTSISLRMAS